MLFNRGMNQGAGSNEEGKEEAGTSQAQLELGFCQKEKEYTRYVKRDRRI